MKRSDIPDEHVIELAQRWQRAPFEQPGVVGALVAEGVPEKLALRKVEHLIDLCSPHAHDVLRAFLEGL